jgi:hypothetical protein
MMVVSTTCDELSGSLSIPSNRRRTGLIPPPILVHIWIKIVHIWIKSLFAANCIDSAAWLSRSLTSLQDGI